MAFRPVPALLATLAVLVLPPATAGGEQDPPSGTTAAPPTGDAAKDTATAQAPPPPTRIDPRRYPRGVTVLVEGWKSPVRAQAYPEGVTVLGKHRRRVGRVPVIRLTVPVPADEAIEASRTPAGDTTAQGPPPETDISGEDLLQDPAAALAEQRRRHRRREPVGPAIDEQLDAFGRPPQSAGRPLQDANIWRPVSAFEKRDPKRPYPWHPARFATPLFDPEWPLTDAWPDRREDVPYPWHPAIFTEPAFDPTWTPVDAWGRSLGVPEGVTRYTVGPPAGARAEEPPAATAEEPTGAQPPAAAETPPPPGNDGKE
ncbi:MAG: hypothetical protein Q9Q40_15175 [Acidobacteriota bacterium]|nr:hypothetical protein [Acidobacteriota bacterium]